MYSNKLIACVKVNGKNLRENGEKVYLPFGSEYSIWLKNENDRKVCIDVEIDGQDTLNEKQLLLGPGEDIELKGFVKNYDGEDNRAFRFIEKTKAISDFRGDKIEDGLVKITYQFEKEKKHFEHYQRGIDHHHHHHHHDIFRNHPYQNNFYYGNSCETLGMTFDSSSDSIGNVQPAVATANIFADASDMQAKSVNLSATSACSANDYDGVTCADLNVDLSGITVEGSETGQTFQQGYVGALETKKHTMIFNLYGLNANEEVVKPITVKTRKQCSSCGKTFKSSFEYCPFDSTFLRLKVD